MLMYYRLNGKSMLLLERIDILLERRGELEAPPAMVEKIYQWAKPRLANFVFNAFMEADVDTSQYGTSGHPLAKALVDDGAFKVRGENLWQEDLETDLDGWPYFKGEHEKVKRMMPWVRVRFDTSKTSHAYAEWKSLGTLTLFFAPILKLVDSWEPRDYEKAKERLRQTIRHELQHMTQTLMRDYVGVETAGLPKFRGNKADKIERLVAYMLDYELDDREFFPLLSDSIAEFKDLKIPVGLRNDAVRMWVDDAESLDRETVDALRSFGIKPHSFFTALKLGDKRKWREAVKRFVTAIG